ncbi:MAG: YidC/Oxa1 family insertase periplasmic-domain containing protein [Lentisphaeria bacterium]
MKYDKVTILGVSACALVFVFLIWWTPKMQPATEPAPPQITENQGTTPSPNSTTTTIPANPQNNILTVSDGEAVAYQPMKSQPAPKNAPVILEKKGICSFSIDPSGSGVTGVELLKHTVGKSRDGKNDGGNVILGHYDYPFLELNTQAAGVRLAPGNAEVSENAVQLTRISSDKKLSFEEQWSLDPEHDYEILYKLKIKNISSDPLIVKDLRLDSGAMPVSYSPGRKTKMGESSGGVAYGVLGGSDSKMLNMGKLKKKMDADLQAELAFQPISWLAVHSKYFLFEMCPKEPDISIFKGLEANVCPALVKTDVDSKQSGRFHGRAIFSDISLEPGESHQVAVSAYAGPKDFKRLHEMGNGLETVMEMDRFFFGRAAWMGWLSRVLLDGMVWISKFFPKSIGYGMGIICLTLLVKLIFWPLTHRSTVSMRKMQALQPQIKELRKKYKKEPQKMYRKQQELFKENHVSQLGGCLPMVFQIPVFFALFNTFRNAIQLRHAGFLWAYDLSMPDDLFFTLFGLPIRPFALLMGGTMYFQQKLTPSGDPSQAKMMNMMSIFFIFLFYGMPSALTLYMTVNQVLTIIQMLWLRKKEKISVMAPVVAQ